MLEKSRCEHSTIDNITGKRICCIYPVKQDNEMVYKCEKCGCIVSSSELFRFMFPFYLT